MGGEQKKKAEQWITQITCHCLFSLKKCQSVRSSGVLLFPVVYVVSFPPPSLRCSLADCVRSKLPCRKNVNISGEGSGLSFTPPVSH